MSDSNPFSPVTEAILHEAWGWLEDCDIVTEDDVENVIDGTWTAADVISNVDSKYEGGWAQFVKDTQPLEQWLIVHERRDARGIMIGVTEKSNFGSTRYRSLNY